MTYELLEKANELYSKIDSMCEIINLFTTRSAICDEKWSIVLSRQNGASNIKIPEELSDKLLAVCWDERDKLEEEFENLK